MRFILLKIIHNITFKRHFQKIAGCSQSVNFKRKKASNQKLLEWDILSMYGKGSGLAMMPLEVIYQFAEQEHQDDQGARKDRLE